MSQDNPQISTTPPLPGLQLVQDLNKALQTLATDFSGETDPAAMAWAYSTWADTGTGTLKRRNAANSAWMIERKLFEDVRLTTSVADTTAGRALKVGDWGIGGSLPVIDGIDLLANDYFHEYYATGALNGPAGTATAGYVKKSARNVSYRKVTFTPYNGRGPWINVCNNGVWAGWVELYHTGNLGSDLQWLGMPVGVPFPLANGVTAPPSDRSSFRFIVLTAGQTGAGGYNQGVLINETVTGSDPTITATAVVSLAGSPLDGKTIDLINTSRVFVRPGAANSPIVDSSNLAHNHGSIPTFTTKRLNGGTTEYGLTTSTGLTGSSGGSEAAPRHLPLAHFMRIL